VAKVVIGVKFLPDVARQKLLKSTNAAWSYAKNKCHVFYGRRCRKLLQILQVCRT